MAVGSEGSEVKRQRTGVASRLVALGPQQGLGQPWTSAWGVALSPLPNHVPVVGHDGSL